MSNDFEGVFDELKPKGTARLPLTGIHVRSEADVVLIGRHAGRDNRGYTNAVLKKAQANQNALGSKLSIAKLETRDADMANLFARYVITAWEGVIGADGKPIPYTPEAGEAFLSNLCASRPDIAGAGGIIDLFFGNPDNFREEEVAAADALGKG